MTRPERHSASAAARSPLSHFVPVRSDQRRTEISGRLGTSADIAVPDEMVVIGVDDHEARARACGPHRIHPITQGTS